MVPLRNLAIGVLPACGHTSGEGDDVVEARPVAVAGVHGEGRQGSASARGEDVELVALRVGENRPRDVALAYVGGRGAEILEARDQVCLMRR